MMRAFLFITLSLVLLACHGSTKPSVRREETRPANTEIYVDEERALEEGREIASKEGRKWINKEKAIAAVASYTKNDRSGGKVVPVICEQVRMWRIVYQELGLEYVIDKNSGIVLNERKLPLEVISDNNTAATPQNSQTITKNDAIGIARQDFGALLKEYGSSPNHIDEFTPFACELKRSWRVVFEYRQKPGQKFTDLPNTNPPLYLIDNETGRIVDREPPMRASDTH
jgi:hypothetical protein